MTMHEMLALATLVARAERLATGGLWIVARPRHPRHCMLLDIRFLRWSAVGGDWHATKDSRNVWAEAYGVRLAA